VNVVLENPPSFFLRSFFARFWPKKGAHRASGWFALPTLLLLLNTAVGGLNLALCLPFFPFLVLTTVLFTLRFKTAGLSLSYLIIATCILWWIPQIPLEQRLWPMGVLFNVALTLYILLLAGEEVDHCFEKVEAPPIEDKNAQHQLETLRLMHEATEQKKQELEEEIKILKEEAELRRIEKIREQNTYERIQAEIELLRSQKEEFIQATSRAAAAALAADQKAKEIELKKLHSVHERDAEEARLKEAHRQLQEALEITKQEIMQLQQKPPIVIEKIVEVPVSSPDAEQKIKELTQEVAQAQGLYTQLRAQFQEKGATLTQTRRTLFATQEQLELVAQEKAEASLAPRREGEQALEGEINKLFITLVYLEEEIACLETLVTAFMNPLP
jgi:hypothetical protein